MLPALPYTIVLALEAACLQFCGTYLLTHLTLALQGSKHKLQILSTFALGPSQPLKVLLMAAGGTAALPMQALHPLQHLPHIHTDSLQSIFSFGVRFLVNSKLSFVKTAIQSEVSGIAFPAGSRLSSVPPSMRFHLFFIAAA